jgi:type I restriction enzyme S subunit
MSEWKKYKLGDLIYSVSDTFKFTDKNVVFLNTSDIYDGKILTKQLSNPKSLPGQAKKRIMKNDILYSEIRPANKRFAIVNVEANEYVVSTKLMVLRAKGTIDVKYLYLYLTATDMLNYLQMIAEDRSGTFPQITFDNIAALDILLPPLSEQKQIAGILSSLDDKIDLLNRENKTLEAMAETLFRKWFVEDAKEDWEEKPLSYFGEIICGKTPSKKKHDFYNGNIPFIKIPDMHKDAFVFQSEDSLSELGRNSQKNKTLPSKSILVSCIATVGLVAMNAFVSQTNQQINSIVPYKSYYRYFLYLIMKSMCFDLQAMASGGTATLNLNTGDFSKISICCPNDDYFNSFNTSVEQYFNKIYMNQIQIITLNQLRNVLLPKLMNREVKVEE